MQHPSMTYESIHKNLDIASFSTICFWKTLVKDLMTLILDEQSSKIGGKDVVVQIDETAISKRKYNVGRILQNQQYWMIRGIDEEGNCFLKISRYRNRNVLEQIICDNVEEGSIIWTDGWGGYNHLAELGFSHGVVIH